MSEPIQGVEKKIVATYPSDCSEPERFRRLLGRVYGSPTPPPLPSKLTTDAVAQPANLRGHLFRDRSHPWKRPQNGLDNG